MNKKSLTICGVIFGVCALAVGALAYIRYAMPKTLSDFEFLTSVSTWQKSDAPAVVWQFREDGTGYVTTYAGQYYDTTWHLNGDELEIDTDWLYQLNDKFKIAIDRENNSFTTTSLTDQLESTFVPYIAK